jgi:hypothetical protein
LQRVIGCVMRAEFGVEVAQNSDANGLGHQAILIESSFQKDSKEVWKGVTGLFGKLK